MEKYFKRVRPAETGEDRSKHGAQQPRQTDGGGACGGPEPRGCAEAPAGRALTAGVVLGDADGLIHQLLGTDAAAVGAENENCLFKDLRVRGVHHDDPAGNAFNQMYALLAV